MKNTSRNIKPTDQKISEEQNIYIYIVPVHIRIIENDTTIAAVKTCLQTLPGLHTFFGLYRLSP